MRKLTHEQFMERLQQINTNIEILGTYINANTKIKCKCKIDGYEWESTPSRLLHGHGCPKCGGNVKLAHEEFITKLKQVNPNIQVLGTYIGSKIKIKCRCEVDGYEWEAWPNNLLSGQGCPKCGAKRTAQKQTMTHEDFMRKFYKKNKHAQDIEILGTYKNNKTKIECKCKKCEHEWTTEPNTLLRGHGCPKCGTRRGTQKQTMTQKEFTSKLKQINTNIEILGTYKTNKTKIRTKCKVCGHEWEVRPSNLLNGHGCPKCSISKGEKRIAQYLDNLGINYIYDKRYFKDLVSVGGSLLRPDFIIPSLKIWIEYDGQQHFRPVDFTGTMSAKEVQQLFEYTQQNDQIKNQYAKDNNWTLIRIPYTEYDNIEQILAEYIEQEQAI